MFLYFIGQSYRWAVRFSILTPPHHHNDRAIIIRFLYSTFLTDQSAVILLPMVNHQMSLYFTYLSRANLLSTRPWCCKTLNSWYSVALIVAVEIVSQSVSHSALYDQSFNVFHTARPMLTSPPMFIIPHKHTFHTINFSTYPLSAVCSLNSLLSNTLISHTTVICLSNSNSLPLLS